MRFLNYLGEGLFHGMKRGWHNFREQMSVAYMQGGVESWYKQGKIDTAGYNTITLAMRNLDALLTKEDYTDQDAEKAKMLITRMNRYINRKKFETDAAIEAGKKDEYMAAHNSGIEDL